MWQILEMLLTSASAVRYGSELCKPALVNRVRKTLENISRHRLSRPTHWDMGQLGAEVVKSCMKTAAKNGALLNICSLHVIPLSTVPVWFCFALLIQSPDLTMAFLRSSLNSNQGKIQDCSLHNMVASLASRSAREDVQRVRESHSHFPVFLAFPAEMLKACSGCCKELFTLYFTHVLLASLLRGIWNCSVCNLYAYVYFCFSCR